MAKNVLLTRAEGQNEKLASLLRAASISPRAIPMLEIRCEPPGKHFKQVAMNLDRYGHIVFVSQNAVACALDDLEAFWPQWPAALRWHAVGAATGRLLRDRGIDVLVPDEPSTEGMLASGVFDRVAGDKILIVRGRGGREQLAQELARRGGEVSYLEVYTRCPVTLAEDERQLLLALLPAVAVIYSGETLQALAANLGEVRKGLSIVVPSGRVRSVAADMGFGDVIVAQGPDEQSMLAAIRVALG